MDLSPKTPPDRSEGDGGAGASPDKRLPRAFSQLEFTVAPEDEGARLDILLARFPEIGSRSQAAALIEEGCVTVEERKRPKSFRVEAGSRVVARLKAEESLRLVPEQLFVPVVFEDERLIVVDKPAGMVTHPSRGHASGTLVHALLSRGIGGGEAFRPGIVHRLDRDTSGLIIAAKDSATHRRLSALIREKELTRVYLALVHGNLSAQEGTVDAPVGRDTARRKTMTIGGAGCRSAVTHFRVVERAGDFTLVEVHLETGRTHQIRVHFLAIGHPVAGDPVYARRDPLGLGRQFLHSHRMGFVHPWTQEAIELVSPLPLDLERALAGLRGSAEVGPG